jgi:hypothetical protein
MNRPLRAWLSWSVVCLPLLYALSIGPVVWMEAYGPIRGEGHRFCGVLYAPYRRVYKSHPALEAAVNRYVNLWVSLGPIP